MVITFIVKAQKPFGYNLSKGDVFIMTTSIKKEKYQQLGSDTLTTNQTNTNTNRLEVIAVNGDVYTLKITGVRRTVSSESPMGIAQLDSDLEGIENNALKIMTGKSYTLEMNRDGKVLKITGVDEISGVMKKELSKDTVKVFADRMLVQQALIEYEIGLQKSFIESQLFIYGANSSDQEWVIKGETIVNNNPVELESTFKWHDDKTMLAEARIDVDVTEKFKEGEQDYVSRDVLTGDQQGIIEVDFKTGMPTSIQSVQIVEGGFEINETVYPVSFILETTTTIVKK